MAKQKQWHDALNIPEQRIGAYAIEHVRHPAGTVLHTGTMRTALIGRQPMQALRFDVPTRWHRLVGPEGVWMTDLPIEQAQHDALLRPITWGRTVLVGGLGLGYAVTQLARRKKVARVCVVEKSREVIDLVWPYLLLDDPPARAKVEVVHADLFDFLEDKRARGWQFDWAFLDIWQSDGLATFFSTVVPLRALAADCVEPHRTFCWNEDVMRGQLHSHLTGALAMIRVGEQTAAGMADALERGGPPWDWSVPFWRWVAQVGVDRAETMVPIYVRAVGLPQHVALWGAAIADEARRSA